MYAFYMAQNLIPVGFRVVGNLDVINCKHMVLQGRQLSCNALNTASSRKPGPVKQYKLGFIELEWLH